MEKVGTQKIWSYFDESFVAREANNEHIRAGSGHLVHTYFELAKKVAELQFRNRDHILLFRGQHCDYKSTKKNSTLAPGLFRRDKMKPPSPSVLEARFNTLRLAERELVDRYSARRFLGLDRLRKHRILRWAILQHYEVCSTPLLDVTQSLRIAASFASLDNHSEDAYVYALAVPNLSGAVTASSEASMQVIRLSSACPPEAVRPHLQEGYLLGEYPDIADFDQKAHYDLHEMDFGKRLVAKFRFNPDRHGFWHSENFQPHSNGALYPLGHRDELLNLTTEIKAVIDNREV